MTRKHRRRGLTRAGLFAGCMALGMAGAASAQLNINATGAGVAIPFVTTAGALGGPSASTIAVLTNGAAGSRIIHFDVINGDPDESWDAKSWQCTLTARETVALEFVNDGQGGTDITFECDAEEGNDGPPFAGNPGFVSSDAERGVLWVTIQNTFEQTVIENILFADFTFLDTAAGVASSASAASFQGLGLNDGDHNFVFLTEYSPFPGQLGVNFLPPKSYPGRLLVFTLDGTTGHPPHVKVGVDWYDDDEFKQDDGFTFDCFGLVDYADVASGLDQLTSPGHMELRPELSVATLAPGGTPHDPDNSRVTPFLCYNLQDAPGGGTTLRPCAQGGVFLSFDIGGPVPFPALVTE
jgi:hypothetical protein